MKVTKLSLIALLSISSLYLPPTIAHRSEPGVSVNIDVGPGPTPPPPPAYYPAPRRRVVREEIYFDPVPVDDWPEPMRRTRVHWVSNRGARFPKHLVSGGHEGPRPLYICRAWYGGGVHPGKVVADNCNITYGGAEIVRKRFEYLAGRGFEWVYGAHGEVPPGAIAGGYEGDRVLYICQAAYAGGVHPGKIVAGYCNIGYGGREIKRARYNVLVRY